MSPSTKQTLLQVYHALREKGYDPIAQISGYLLTDDPTYITNHSHARSMVRKLDREAVLREVTGQYFRKDELEAGQK